MTTEPPPPSEPLIRRGLPASAEPSGDSDAVSGDAVGSDASPFVEDRVEEDAALATEAARRRVGPVLQWPLLVVLAGLVVSLMIVAADHFRRGSVLFALFVGLAFVLRLVLPEEEAGWLAVRSRRVDALVLGSLAAALMIFSAIVPPPS